MCCDYLRALNSSFCFSGRASPLKLNLKLNIKLLRNNSKYNFNIISSVATKSLFPLVCCRSAQLFKSIANKVQGECRAELARAMLSRSLYSRCISNAQQRYEKVLVPARVFLLPGDNGGRLIFFRLAKFLFPPIGRVASAHWKAKNRPSRAEKLFLCINIF